MAVAHVLKLELPWPPKALSPNARHGHWGSRSKPVARYRAYCRFATLGVTRGRQAMDAPLRVELEFRPPDRRERDEDNLLARMKSGLDGVADALGVNDKRFRVVPHVGKPALLRRLACVLVRITLDEPKVESL
jgi:crossover junction endodeoxyribonuclease RusA